MRIGFWSPKGGSGVTTITVMVANTAARMGYQSAMVGGFDMAVALGVDYERLKEVDSPPLPIASNLLYVRDEDESFAGDAYVDCSSGDKAQHEDALERCHANIMILRPCMLSLLAAEKSSIRADGIVLFESGGEVIRQRDVESVLNLPVIGYVRKQQEVRRAIDSGRLVKRAPMSKQLSSIVRFTHLLKEAA